MRLLPALVVPVIAVLAGCGGGAGDNPLVSASGSTPAPVPAQTAPAPGPSSPAGASTPSATPTTAAAAGPAPTAASPDPLGLGGLASLGVGLPGGGAPVAGGGAPGAGLPQPSAALPSTFPPGFPLPTGARVTGASDRGGHGHVQLTVSDTRTAFRQLKSALPGAGYAVSDGSPVADTGTFVSGHVAFSGKGYHGTVDAQGGAPGFLTVDYDH